MKTSIQSEKNLRRVSMMAAFSMLYCVNSFGATFTVDGGSGCASFNWNATTQSLSCVAQQTPPPSSGTPVCTLTASTNSVAANTPVTLAVGNCNPAATSYLWSANTGFGNVATTGTGSSVTGGVVVPSTTTTYSVQGVNISGTGAAANATVTVTAVSLPPPTGSCGTNVAHETIDWDRARGNVYQRNLPAGQQISIKFHTPTYPVTAIFQMAEGQAPLVNVTKTVAISTIPCDFTQRKMSGEFFGFNFTANKAVFRTPQLLGNTDYYINIKNESPANLGVDTCLPQYPGCGFFFGITY